MKHIYEWLKAEVVTISDEGKSFAVRSWHVVTLALVVGWLLG